MCRGHAFYGGREQSPFRYERKKQWGWNQQLFQIVLRIFASADCGLYGRLRLLPLGKELRKGLPVEVLRVIAKRAGHETLQKRWCAETVFSLQFLDSFFIKSCGVCVKRIFPLE